LRHGSIRSNRMRYDIEFEQEEDGRWIAEIVSPPA
jgi:hypothetical protein